MTVLPLGREPREGKENSTRTSSGAPHGKKTRQEPASPGAMESSALTQLQQVFWVRGCQDHSLGIEWLAAGQAQARSSLSLRCRGTENSVLREHCFAPGASSVRCGGSGFWGTRTPWWLQWSSKDGQQSSRVLRPLRPPACLSLRLPS